MQIRQTTGSLTVFPDKAVAAHGQRTHWKRSLPVPRRFQRLNHNWTGCNRPPLQRLINLRGNADIFF